MKAISLMLAATYARASEMFIPTTDTLDTVATDGLIGDDASKHCISGNHFCRRTREFKLQALKQHTQQLNYHVQAESIEIDDDDSTLRGTMSLGCDSRGYLAGDIDFEVSFYQDGITRFLIGEKDNDRFRISQEDLPVVWDQLDPHKVKLSESIDILGSKLVVSGL